MEEHMISQGSNRTLPVEEPAVAATSPVLPLGDVFADEPTSFDDNAILGLPVSLYSSVLSEDDEDGEDDDDTSDSDSEIEDHDNQVRFWDGDAAGSQTDLVAEPQTFLGRMTRFASFQGVAGFMRISAAQASTGRKDNREGGVIVVHYRLTHFLGTQSGGLGGVLNCGTAGYNVQYFVPFPVAATDPESSLRLIGAELAADFYPYRSYVQLQALWASLVAVLPVRVSPQATRVVVTVDVGMLRSEDRTPERMECMRAALEEVARKSDAWPVACGREQRVPVPVCCDKSSSGGEVAWPSKRTRFNVEGEVCAICQETLEQGLAAWPRCWHVFHGKCLEQLLVTVQHRCPLCRSTL